MSLPLWEYKICESSPQIQSKGIFRGTEGYWKLEIDGAETGLEEGLAQLGAKGWELAGVQTIRTEDHGKLHHNTFPKSFYIFKRPM